MIRRPGWIALAASWLVLAGCVSSDFEELSSLAAKPALPYSVWITGGSFIDAPRADLLPAPLDRTFALAEPDGEAFALQQLAAILERGNVFVAVDRDRGGSSSREIIAGLGADMVAPGDALRGAMRQGRESGCDFLLVVERVIDGPIEYRGINDRWPFTLGAWLFALGALIPDLSFESRARLRLSVRDVYSGERVFGPILIEPGPADLSMFDRCGIWGFVQSILVPPFWTSTDPESVTESVRAVSTERMLVTAVRRLKSAELKGALDRSGPASIEILRDSSGWSVGVAAAEPIGSVVVRVDGVRLTGAPAETFERELVQSRQVGGPGYVYQAHCPVPSGATRLQILIETEAARISSATQRLRDR